MKIYTKKGDKGETSLFRGGRISKASLRVRAYGTVDELNSFIGFARSQKLSDKIDEALDKAQHDLFVIGSDLSTGFEKESASKTELRLPKDSQAFLENAIDEMETELEPLKNFILPGGTQTASALHIARTICRRAERECVELAQSENINPHIIIYLNRLSDFLFDAARYENKIAGKRDVIWQS